MGRLQFMLLGVALAGCGRIGFDDLGVTVDTARGMLSVGDAHVCALHDGGVWCWGEGDGGQIGDGQLGPRFRPVRVPNMTDPISISAGTGHSCTVLAAGDVWCWGYNGYGQLGMERSLTFAPPPSEYPDPGKVTTLPGPAIEVGAGYDHTCALLADETVWCWGANQHGQLGRGTSSANGELPGVVPGLTGIARLAIADDSSCVLHADGRVSCWGENGRGQLATGDKLDQLAPKVIPGLTASALTMGGDHLCALVQGGHFTCWGANSSGELGGGPSGDRMAPTVISNEDDYIQIDAGNDQTCGLHANGKASCWGYNGRGALGDGTLESRETPALVANLAGAANVSTGGLVTCALKTDGEIDCWGYGSRGALGSGVGAAATPQPVGLQATAVTAGGEHSCVASGNGVRCWGNNEEGQLGDGTLLDRTAPVAVAAPWGATPVGQLAAGSQHTCALLTSGQVWCWGANGYGQTSDSTSPSLSPVQVPLGMAATSIGAGEDSTCALLADKTVACWGYNADGQLGDGTTTSSEVPRVVGAIATTLTAVDELAVAGSSACARIGVEVWCWGDDYYGQLGNGTSGSGTSQTRAVQATITGATALFGGAASMCAVGTGVNCWGRNDSNLLHGGTMGVESLPVTSTETAPFALGFDNACTPAGTCWGQSELGQSGTGSFDYLVTAAPLVGVPAPATIAIGGSHSCAIASTGAVYCWGEDARGQLGTGVASLALSPFVVKF